jgi:hypothetical protein
MSSAADQTQRYYRTRVDAEWERLFKDAFNRLEYAATGRCMDPYLPSSGLVLDAGGGPGRCSLALAHRGGSPLCTGTFVVDAG